MSGIALFWTVLKASMLSSGGLGNVPILHADLVRTGLATQRQFTSSIAVGQLSPGPSGLWVVALGYLLGGLAGALAALVAVCIPPLFVLVIAGLVRRAGEHPGVEGFVWGLGITVVGVSSAVMLILLREERNLVESIVVAVAALALGLWSRAPVIAVLLAGAVVGLLWR